MKLLLDNNKLKSRY